MEGYKVDAVKISTAENVERDMEGIFLTNVN